jgi:hypothetical protein
MSKRAVKVPRLRAGRRVRWTFEVSADLDAPRNARTQKPSKQRRGRTHVTNRPNLPAGPEASEKTAAPAIAPGTMTTTSPVANASAAPRRTLRPQLIGLAIVALVVAVTLALPHRPSPVAAATPDTRVAPVTETSDITPVPEIAPVSEPVAAQVAAAPVVAPRTVMKSSAKPAALKPAKVRIAESASPREAVTAIDKALSHEDSTPTLAASETISAEPAVVPEAATAPGTVTITGCLEASVDSDRFRLTDTEGVEAPKSRSWRSGFLKKHSTPVALVEPPDPHGLRTQIGHRVAATGVLTSHDLRVTSLRAIGARCD